MPVKIINKSQKDQFFLLCRELDVTYDFYLQSQDKSIYTLALVNIFAQFGEFMKYPEIKALIKQSGDNTIETAFTAIKAFRNKEYHSGDLFESITDVQTQFVILIDYLTPAFTKTQRDSNSSKNTLVAGMI